LAWVGFAAVPVTRRSGSLRRNAVKTGAMTDLSRRNQMAAVGMGKFILRLTIVASGV
jgi:hypothetical protein